jgi:lyso-ornithine lipid O-acyltransferase
LQTDFFENMGKIRAVCRLLYLVLFTIWIVLGIVVVNFVLGPRPRFSMLHRRRWARHALWAIGVDVTIEGEPPTQPCLLLCNHRSYLDPLMVLHDVFCYPVSKAEIGKWPVLGYGARMSGILYVQRESISSRRQTLDGIVSVIKEKGAPVLLFPEGTTHDTATTGPFKRGAFQLAAAEGIPVVPAVLEYGSPKDYWVGNSPFVAHFLKRFSEKRVYAKLRYGHPLQSDDTQALMGAVKDWMDAHLKD